MNGGTKEAREEIKNDDSESLSPQLDDELLLFKKVKKL